MRWTADQLNRATLERQLLLRRHDLPVVEAVRRVVALQAQEPASPYLALWNRIADFEPMHLDLAFAEGALAKATLMRVTLHAVAASDWAGFHQAMLPSLQDARLMDRRFTGRGHSPADAHALLPDLVEFTARDRTGAEIVGFIEEKLGADPTGMWWALRTFAPLHRVPSGGAWSFTPALSFRSATAVSRLPSAVAARARLLERYLEGFGPASLQDFAQFTLLRRAATRDALQELRDRVQAVEGPDGCTLYDLPGSPRPTADVVAPARLLPMWDSILLAYADRSRLIPPQYRPAVVRRNGDVLPTLLVDGRVAGLWRAVDGGIEATAFHRLDDEMWAALAVEARGLTAFLSQRDPTVYRRFHHWWNKELPRAEVHVLPG